MFTNEMSFKNYCPLVEEFHIKNIVGAKERKQSIFGGRTSLHIGVTTADLTFSTLSGKIIEVLASSRILVQKLNSAPTSTAAYVTSKGTHGFTMNGDGGCDYSIIVLGTEPLNPASQKKWAKDYCPFCRSQGFDGIVGEVLRDQVLFTFKHTMVAGADAILFRNQTLVSITDVAKGSMAGPLVSLMDNDDYQIVITKSTVTAITVRPFPSAITKAGFTLNGDAGEDYDVFVLGSILN